MTCPIPGGGSWARSWFLAVGENIAGAHSSFWAALAFTGRARLVLHWESRRSLEAGWLACGRLGVGASARSEGGQVREVCGGGRLMGGVGPGVVEGCKEGGGWRGRGLRGEGRAGTQTRREGQARRDAPARRRAGKEAEAHARPCGGDGATCPGQSSLVRVRVELKELERTAYKSESGNPTTRFNRDSQPNHRSNTEAQPPRCASRRSRSRTEHHSGCSSRFSSYSYRASG